MDHDQLRERQIELERSMQTAGSLVIRRGLALLASHLAGIKSKAAMKREHTALVFSVR